MSEFIHRIWLGSEMPETYREYGKEWSSLNPDWFLKDWNEESIFDSNWQNKTVLNQMRMESKHHGADMIAYYTHVADVVCYELIYQYGGLYVNTDVKPLKPLSVLNIDPTLPALAMEDDVHAVNMAMYSPTGDRFFSKVIENLPGRYFGMPKAGMHITTGVGLLMQTLAEYPFPVVRWHRDVFNPIHWSTIEAGTTPNLERQYPANTIAVHSWSHKEFMRGHEVLPN